MLLFWRKGFATASMHDLCEAMGIGSPSLYAAFGSKEALYLEAIEHYVRTQGPRVWDRLAEGATARAGVENMLLAGAGFLPKSRATPAGCMVLLGAVGDEWPAAVARVARKVRLELLGKLRARLRAAVAKGELPDSTDTEGLSRLYFGVLEGMATQAQDGATSAELKGVAAAAMAAWPVA
ncbi:TetR/AcrR family transcriptional regulator [Bradyrhizobium lablabi]|uniref:TetR/AcrR family transcriptional regulator n=1 Tax=Bradyrhizobium lablabi TaxID=722472 RepID=UPI0020118888|nr:TetR/AcrR family transcriptional regulator [Bradyrhizobium lablabi]